LTIPCGIRALSAEAKKASYMALNSVI
jgi:hypothetical protein